MDFHWGRAQSRCAVMHTYEALNEYQVRMLTPVELNVYGRYSNENVCVSSSIEHE